MLIDKYTKHTIFSLPLIFDNVFVLSDLRANEFINMYTCDVNKPFLSNHIFLVFHNISDEFLSKLREHHLYVCDYLFTIDKIKYISIVFERAFTIYSIVNKIDHGLYYSLFYEDKVRIMNFWKVSVNSNIHKYLFNEKIVKLKPLNESITEYN